MKNRKTYTRIGAFLLAGAIMLGGAAAPSTAFAESDAGLRNVALATMPTVGSESGILTAVTFDGTAAPAMGA